MPRRVDRDLRRGEILEAVVRITVRGGLSSATFREVAAEAGVSVRLVQYYFGTKDGLLLATQRHVAKSSVERIGRLLEQSSGTPRDVLRIILRSFIPVDQESRDAMLMFVALFTASLLDPTLKRAEAHEVPSSLRQTVADQLRTARLRPGVDPDQEALRLAVTVPGLAQGVLDGQLTANEAFVAIDYSLDHALG